MHTLNRDEKRRGEEHDSDGHTKEEESGKISQVKVFVARQKSNDM